MQKNHKYNWGYMVFALLCIFGIQIWLEARSFATLDYSEFLGYLKDGQITDVTVTETLIQGSFGVPVDGKEHFITQRVEPDFAAQLEKSGVRFAGSSDQNWFTTLLSWTVPILFFFVLWMVVFRKMADRQGMGGLINIGKSKAKVYVERDTGVTFDDVAGVDEARAELEEIVSFLRDRETYGRLGARIPKGILLVGPPGTGKTLLARAVAGQAKVPFFSIAGSEFVEMFVGVGAARVRDLFDQARKAAPCIIFIDELDALGRARSAMSSMGGGDEKEQTLNQLLSELDGFDPSVGIVLLAATNRPEILDPALLRAGRFDRQVVVDRPERKGRAQILGVHARKVKLDSDVDLDKIAAITTGFTGADLANLINEAAIIATRRGGNAVSAVDLTLSVERIVAGSERKTRILQPDERKRVAFHELGHALTAASLPSADQVHKVSIVPRSVGALGFTMQRPTEDRFLITYSDLKDRMTVLLAGRAAEDIVFGEISTGASDDLAKATDIARDCVTRFGMSPAVGQAVLEAKHLQWLGAGDMQTGSKDYSEATAREVDLAIRAMIEDAYDRAKAILSARRSDLEAGAALLLERESLTPEDFAPLRKVSGTVVGSDRAILAESNDHEVAAADEGVQVGR
ncbi:ATP-dependent zinc metalloprotease FtsH [Puniceibacterium sediminis]|uniref:ATP-dependent zinc metalloprotease FtsH n=1 Tax=Puniceibacterium sediminis TaxID=1608407 RepID=A0A238ZNS8_9RHOB|nr:ATP-dependent zinc metalloprotease FtsH [Puniceibacterium sediminis]SNR84829.1 cell division protease FtsH [Puniceibacterium sediminis]